MAPRTTRAHDEAGFTLVELMVTLLIIGILIAIALPTFLGARARASERSAQTQLHTALTTARVHLAEQTDYTTLSPAAMGVLETSQVYNAGPVVLGEVSVRDVSATTVLLVAVSDTGEYFCIADDTAAISAVYRGRSSTDSFAVVADCIGGW